MSLILLNNNNVDLVLTTRFWNNLYQVRSNSIDWKDIKFKNLWEKQITHCVANIYFILINLSVLISHKFVSCTV